MTKKLIYSLYFFNLAVILFFWWNNSGSLLLSGFPGALIALGRVCGLLAAAFVLMQFMFIGRAIWLERTFGLDKLSRVHRINGQITIFFILLHPLFITLGYAFSSKTSITQQFMNLILKSPDVWQALLAAILFTIIVAFSIYIVRKRLKYETWYYIHVFMYLAVLLAWGHQLKNGEDFLANKWFVYYWYAFYIFVLGNHLIFRFLRPLYLMQKHHFYVEKVVPETYDTNSIYISGKNMEQFKVEAGQFMIFRFINKQFWWQAHPFSMSMLPNGKQVRISVKNVGDFTSQIGTVTTGTPVEIDGPHGVFTAKHVQKDKILLVAGGIGITPLRSLSEQLLALGKDVILIYGNKTDKDIVFKQEFEALQKQYNFPIHHVLSNITEETPPYIKGYVDKDKLQTLVKDITEREVFFCGPPIMMDKLKVALGELGVPKNMMHYERFAL